MTSRKLSSKWSGAFKALAIGLVSLALFLAVPAMTILADGSHNMCPGQPGPNGGTQCTTGSLIIGISAVVVNATDCTTGVAIPPEKLTFDLVFREGANAPYSVNDLKAIIVTAAGYVPATITSFVQMQLNLVIFVVNIIFAGNACLPPLVVAPPEPPTPSAPTCIVTEFKVQQIKLTDLTSLAPQYGSENTNSGSQRSVLQHLSTQVSVKYTLRAQGEGRVGIKWDYGLKNRGFGTAVIGKSGSFAPLPDSRRSDYIEVDCKDHDPERDYPYKFVIDEYSRMQPGDYAGVSQILLELQRLERNRLRNQTYNLNAVEYILFQQTVGVVGTVVWPNALPPSEAFFGYRKKLLDIVLLVDQGNLKLLGWFGESPMPIESR